MFVPRCKHCGAMKLAGFADSKGRYVCAYGCEERLQFANEIYQELLDDLGDPAREDPDMAMECWYEAEAQALEEVPVPAITRPRDMFDFLEDLGVIVRAQELRLGQQDADLARGTRDTYDWLDASESNQEEF